MLLSQRPVALIGHVSHGRMRLSLSPTVRCRARRSVVRVRAQDAEQQQPQELSLVSRGNLSVCTTTFGMHG